MASGNIFISYRRDDEPGFAARLHDRLEQAFPGKQIFIDVDDIPPGTDFEAHLDRQVVDCDVALILIGEKWLDVRNPDGSRRLFSNDDFVLKEVKKALAHCKLVIPILINAAQMPGGNALPTEIKGLSSLQAVRVTYDRWKWDTDYLIQFLGGEVADARPGLSLFIDGKSSFTSYFHNLLVHQNTAKLAGLCMAAGMLLLYASSFIGIDSIHLPPRPAALPMDCHVGKQVGLIYAPNWSIVYLVLFPFYLILFASLAKCIDTCINSVYDARYDMQQSSAYIEQLVRKEFLSTEVLLKVILGASALVALSGWYLGCGAAILHFKLTNEVVDWSKAIVYCNSGNYSLSLMLPSLIFTFIAFLWMGFALFIYLALLFLGYIYSSALLKLAETVKPSPSYQALLKDKLVAFFYIYYGAGCLGLMSAYCMRLQAAYLLAPNLNLVSFLTQNLRDMIGAIAGSVAAVQPAAEVFQSPGATNQTAYTGMFVLGITFLALIGTVYNLLQTVSTLNARNRKDGLADQMPEQFSPRNLVRLAIVPGAICVSTATGCYTLPMIAGGVLFGLWSLIDQAAASKAERRSAT